MMLKRTPGILCSGVLFCLVCTVNAAQPDGNAQSRATALYRKGDLHRACPMFADLASREPRSGLARLYLVGCAIQRRDRRAIAAARESLRRLSPGPAVAHAMAGDWLASAGYCVEAGEEYSRAAAPGIPGTVEFALAQCEQNTGNVDVALKLYRTAIDLNPDREEQHLSMAFLLIGMGQSDEAGKVLVEAAHRFPNSVRVLVTMSILHLELGYTDRARMGYEKARALAPDAPIVWKLLGRIQMAEGAAEEATNSLERAVAQDPKDAQAYLFMGTAQAKLDGGSEKALTSFLRALELDPALTEARFQAASVYFQTKGDYVKAAAELEKVVAAAPGFTRAYQLLAQAYQRLGQPEKAAAAAKRLRALEAQ